MDPAATNFDALWDLNMEFVSSVGGGGQGGVAPNPIGAPEEPRELNTPPQSPVRHGTADIGFHLNSSNLDSLDTPTELFDFIFGQDGKALGSSPGIDLNSPQVASPFIFPLEDLAKPGDEPATADDVIDVNMDAVKIEPVDPEELDTIDCEDIEAQSVEAADIKPPKGKKRVVRSGRVAKRAAIATPKRAAAANLTAGSAKLYEAKPFKNPELERNRRNAINAKINRDRKKNELAALNRQMELLRAQVGRLTGEREDADAREAALRKEVDDLHELMRANGLGHMVAGRAAGGSRKKQRARCVRST